MNKAKQDRRLKSLWYKKDLDGWFQFKLKIGRYPKNLKFDNSAFKEDMLIWNEQFTHEETQLKNYPDWNPYCCNEIEPCNSRAWDRMEKTEDGWVCGFCNMKIGKHLSRIPNSYKPFVITGWNNYAGRPHMFIKTVLSSCGTDIGRGMVKDIKTIMDVNRYHILEGRKEFLRDKNRMQRSMKHQNLLERKYFNSEKSSERHTENSGGNERDEVFIMPKENVFKIGGKNNKLENLEWVKE